MTQYNRFSVQIVGTVDGDDPVIVHQQLKDVLGNIVKFRIKAVNVDQWIDGYTGKIRVFDENGDEIIDRKIVTTDQQIEPTVEDVEVILEDV